MTLIWSDVGVVYTQLPFLFLGFLGNLTLSRLRIMSVTKGTCSPHSAWSLQDRSKQHISKRNSSLKNYYWNTIWFLILWITQTNHRNANCFMQFLGPLRWSCNQISTLVVISPIPAKYLSHKLINQGFNLLLFFIF